MKTTIRATKELDTKYHRPAYTVYRDGVKIGMVNPHLSRQYAAYNAANRYVGKSSTRWRAIRMLEIGIESFQGVVTITQGHRSMRARIVASHGKQLVLEWV